MQYLHFIVPLLSLGALAWLLFGVVGVSVALLGKRGWIQAIFTSVTFVVNILIVLHMLMPVIPSTPPGIYFGWVAVGVFMLLGIVVSGWVHRKRDKVDDRVFFTTVLRVYQTLLTMVVVVVIALLVRLMAYWPQLLMGLAMLLVGYVMVYLLYVRAANQTDAAQKVDA